MVTSSTEGGVWVWGSVGCQWALHSASEFKNLCENAEMQAGPLPLSPRQGWVTEVVYRLGLIGQSDDVKLNHSLENCWIKEANKVNYQTCFSHQKPERLSLEDLGEWGRAGVGSVQQLPCTRGHTLRGDWTLGRESCSRTLALDCYNLYVSTRTLLPLGNLLASQTRSTLHLRFSSCLTLKTYSILHT